VAAEARAVRASPRRRAVLLIAGYFAELGLAFPGWVLAPLAGDPPSGVPVSQPSAL